MKTNLPKSLAFTLGLAILFAPSLIFAREELTVIQTVSTDRRSFVVSKGIKEGVVKGQEVIFANDNVSIVCRAKEVNRDYSLWVPVDRTITVPFKKEDMVSSNSTVYGNVALEVVGDTGLMPAVNFNETFKKFRTQNNFSLKASYNRGLSQSSSSVSEEKNSSRAGYTVSAEYNYRFLPEFEMSAGARIDNEVYRIENPELDIPTSRIMATIAATYHFVNFSNNQNNFYLTLAAGIGRSETTVDEEKSSGIVALLPEARLGYIMPFSKGMALVVEASVESLNSKESFSDGTQQTTNTLTSKFSVGLRF
jgi:hypothetical protein